MEFQPNRLLTLIQQAQAAIKSKSLLPAILQQAFLFAAP
jgi:hypothetical protein